MEVSFTVNNASGQVLQVLTDDYEAGYNELNLIETKLPQGLLFYTMKTDQFTATKRMMNIKR